MECSAASAEGYSQQHVPGGEDDDDPCDQKLSPRESAKRKRVLFFSKLPEYFCWIPSDNSVGRHIFGHDTARANNGMLAHSNTS